MIFPPKTLALVPNVQGTLVWGQSDFQRTLGYAVPEKPVSFVFTVTNPTNAVVYVAISYQTLITTYNINDRKTIAGIPANSSLRISSNSARELSALGPDLVAITLYFIGPTAGTITVVAEAADATIGFTAGGAGQLFGADARSVKDFIQGSLEIVQVCAVGTTSLQTTVPTGKAIDVVGLNVSMPPTPFRWGDVDIFLGSLSTAVVSRRVYSKQFEPTDVNMFGFLFQLIAGQILYLAVNNNNPALGKFVAVTAIYQEYFI